MAFDRKKFKVLHNKRIAKDVYCLELLGDTRAIKCPGQFVNIEVASYYLRRPMSIADWKLGDETTGKLIIIYKVVGGGTAEMAKIAPGEFLDLLVPLGNGFDINVDTTHPLIVGGGVGTPPLIALAAQLIACGKIPQVVLGFQSEEDVFAVDTFQKMHPEVTVHVATVDGTLGTKGFVTHVMEHLTYDYIFACGPIPMLEAVVKMGGALPGQYSFEARMACGFGACMGCSQQTTTGYKRICKEGPVLWKEDLQWLI
ncbi:dihydroorotate dehydrogenase electron transfer subunit [Allofustis seminis]|uniref:dihydroorotate dehydrogenase electron transfer subunit n=1 Tax=Allofustis seminis TaxID=166939 RepID=UPI00036FAFE8|nr:dihydroorotate dehydrogenase electron transfer subunit [Allofustis seminis]